MSARPITLGLTAPMTLPMAAIPEAPMALMASSTIAAISSSLKALGKYTDNTSISACSLSARSCLLAAVYCSMES